MTSGLNYRRLSEGKLTARRLTDGRLSVWNTKLKMDNRWPTNEASHTRYTILEREQV